MSDEKPAAATEDSARDGRADATTSETGGPSAGTPPRADGDDAAGQDDITSDSGASLAVRGTIVRDMAGDDTANDG